TIQRKPFVPFTAVVYPSCPSTITAAPSEIDLGAALRASAISALCGIMYSLTGAIAGYEFFCVCVSEVAHDTTISVANARTKTLTLFFCIQFSGPAIARCRLAYLSSHVR